MILQEDELINGMHNKLYYSDDFKTYEEMLHAYHKIMKIAGDRGGGRFYKGDDKEIKTMHTDYESFLQKYYPEEVFDIEPYFTLNESL